MIALLAAIVVFFILAPVPVFAIPSGDILGPVLTWFATMVGFASAGFFIIGTWMNRRIRLLTKSSRQALLVLLLFSFTALVAGFGWFAWKRYEGLQNLIDASYQRDQQRAQDLLGHATFTQVLVPVSPPKVAPGSTDLISSRVAVSTKLVPTSVLREVVKADRWSERIMVLDIREPEEHEIGEIPTQRTDIRYGDLIHDLPRLLPRDRDILVICWTSKRGEEITTLLRQQGYPRAFAIQGGLQGEPIQGIKDGDPGWIEAGLPWRGDDRWSDRFTNFTYIPLAEAYRRFQAGATIIDARDPEIFVTGHVPGATHLSIKYLTTASINQVISTFDVRKKTLLIICEGYVDCFYARVLGVRLSRLGWVFDEPFREMSAWQKTGYPIDISSF
jgi:rhodanese-related sulfurtransferase